MDESTLIQSVVPLGASGVLLVLLVRSHLRQGDSWEQIVRAERETATQARADAAAALKMAEEARDEAERSRRAEMDCHRRIAALERRIADLEGNA